MGAVGQFIQFCAAPNPITVVRALGATLPGSNVRVPEPIEGDFAVITSLSQERLEFNETTFQDIVFAGSIAGDVLTVSSVTRGVITPGQLLTDIGYPDGSISAGTTIVAQLSGGTGGVGTYTVSAVQTVAAEAIYSGTRTDTVGTKWTVQLDIHGPNSANNANVIDTLFRSEVGCDFFTQVLPNSAPLNIVSRGLQPFENAEQEVEWRWVLQADLEVVVVVTTPQMFADEVEVPTTVVATQYTG